MDFMQSHFSILQLAQHVVAETRKAIPFSENSDEYFPTFRKEEPEDYSTILYMFFRGNLGNRTQNESNKAIYEEIRRKVGVEFLPESTFKEGLTGITALFPITLRTAGKTFNSIHELAVYAKKIFSPHEDQKKKRSPLEFIEAHVIRALKNRVGNCGENSAYAFLLLMEYQDIDPSIEIKLERCAYQQVPNEDRDHAFVVLNRTVGNLNNISSWNDDAVICDPWVGQAYTIAQWKKWIQGIDPRPAFYILEANYAVQLIDPFNATFTKAYVGEKQNLSHNIPIHSDKWLNKNSSATKPFRPLKLITSKMNSDLAEIRQLYQAAKTGDLHAVNDYILSTKHTIDFSALMELAIENNQKNIIEYLIENNHIDLKKDYLWYLNLALANNHIDIFDQINKALSRELSPHDYYYFLFPLARNGNVSLFKKFMDNAKWSALLNYDGWKNIMSAAVENGHSEVLDYLISRNPAQYHDEATKQRLLSHACQHNQLDLAKRFINEGVDPTYCDGLFFSAVKENYREIAKLLLENNANIHEIGYHDKRPLYPYEMAIINGNLDLALAILQKSSARSNYSKSIINNKNLLHLAVTKNDLQIVEQALQTKRFDINQLTRDGFTALAIASNSLDKNNPEKSNLDIILALAKESAVCKPDKYQMILKEKLIHVINEAIENNQIDLIKKCGQIAKLCQINHIFHEPLERAILNNQIAIVSQLLNAGATINIDLFPPAVTMANKTGNTDILTLLLDHTNIKQAYFALKHAINPENGISIDLLKMLIEHPKIDINLAPNSYSASPLNYAVEYGTLECVQTLLSYKTTFVNQSTQIGWTALHTAAQSGRSDIVKELLKHPDIDSNLMAYEQTAMMIAEEQGHSEIVKLLTDHIENKKTNKDLTKPPEITQTSLGLFSNPNQSALLSKDDTPTQTISPRIVKKD